MVYFDKQSSRAHRQILCLKYGLDDILIVVIFFQMCLNFAYHYK